MKTLFSILGMTGTLLIFSACTGEKDLQGIDPNVYYKEHPIENKVETRQLSQDVRFASGQSSLTDEERNRLHDGLRIISPLAVDSIIIRMAKSDQYNQARKNTLVALLTKMGYGKIKVQFQPSESVAHGTAWVDVGYLAVVAPDCPDWRMSPVTTYSNTSQGNTKCSQEVNLGLMVADPHDLVRGTGDTGIMSSSRDAKAVQDYNEGKDFMPNTLNAGGGGSSGGSSGSSSGNLSGSGTSSVAAGTSGLTGSSGGGSQ